MPVVTEPQRRRLELWPVYRASVVTGQTKIWCLPVTLDQLEEFSQRGRNGRLIQEIFPDLTPAQREFIKSGYTPHDWRVMFGCEECGGRCFDCECEEFEE